MSPDRCATTAGATGGRRGRPRRAPAVKFAAEALPSRSHFFFRRRREAREEVMSSRRNVRLRREYLYRKQLETNDRIVYEKKRKLKQAIESGNAARLPPAPCRARPALRPCLLGGRGSLARQRTPAGRRAEWLRPLLTHMLLARPRARRLPRAQASRSRPSCGKRRRSCGTRSRWTMRRQSSRGPPWMTNTSGLAKQIRA